MAEPYFISSYDFLVIGEKSLIQGNTNFTVPDAIRDASPSTKVQNNNWASSITEWGYSLPYGNQSGSDNTNDNVIFENEYLKIHYGKITEVSGSTMYGFEIVDKIANTAIGNGGWGNPSWGRGTANFGILVIPDEERAYFLYRAYSNNSGYSYWYVGGKTDGIDLIYESFVGTHTPTYTSNGGGATHIAKVTGQLKDLSSNLSDILMVSGGGGGGLLVGDTNYSGKEAGGISGSGDNSADQSTGNAFGQGESGNNVSGGGSGLYGGYKGTSAKSGGAGCGYIGNSLLSNKKMVGYNVPTSSAKGTKTESVNEVSASAVSGKPKSGNGFAKIKFLRDLEITATMLASNGLAITETGETPVLNSGTMGVYDSQTDSYYFASDCEFKYSGEGNILTPQVLNACKSIEFEEEFMISSSVLSTTDKSQILVTGNWTNPSHNFRAVFANALVRSASNRSVAEIYIGSITPADYKWSIDSPMDSSDNRNAFHTVKEVWEMENLKVKKISLYFDGTLIDTTLPNYQLNIASNSIGLYAGAMNHSYIKSIKIKVK